MANRLTIGVVGAGGDGVVVLGSFLQRLTASQGYFSSMPRYYGAQIRGGGSGIKLSLDGESVPVPRDSLDILVSLDWDKYLELKRELALTANTMVLYEKDPPAQIELPGSSLQIAFSRASQEATGSARDKNILALGLLTRLLGLPQDRVRNDIAEDHKLHLVKEKIKAFEAGERLYSELPLPPAGLSPASVDSARLVLHGSAAMARAAAYGGCRAFFGYPITPAAEIMQGMQKALSQGKGVYLQAEDEIAAAGLAVGASLTGAKALTSTSGPGFDLMTEMMGLAVAAEIPMVIIDVQRCGPSTGIPSKSEQSDLNHAIYGGHGDAPRVVIAPYDVEGCYRLVIESLNIAQRFQTVVVVLSDQYLGQTFVAVDGAFLEVDYPVWDRKTPGSEDIGHYRRYQHTGDYISPMSAAGDEGLAYRTSGLTHNEGGAPAFDFETHQGLHDKRWEKLAPLGDRKDLVQFFGNEQSRKGIVTWGSSAQVVLETVRELGLEGEVRVCVPELIHPMPKVLQDFAGSMEHLLTVEMNHSGQMHRYLRSEIDVPRNAACYCRAGGRPFSRDELRAPIVQLVA
jgi:2-oxoglutarate ferredoxin oxidoreductase subunit alpha